MSERISYASFGSVRNITNLNSCHAEEVEATNQKETSSHHGNVQLDIRDMVTDILCCFYGCG